MDASLRAARMLVRLVAGCIILIGLLDVSVYVARCLEPAHPQPVRPFPIVLNSIPVLVGLGVWIKSRPIAQWIADQFE